MYPRRFHESPGELAARKAALASLAAVADMVRYELDGHVATITYNRPDALNAIDQQMRSGAQRRVRARSATTRTRGSRS